MEHIDITRVTLNDIYQLQKIGRETFRQAFSDFNTEENMKKYLEESFSLDNLNSEISNSDSKYFFAKMDDNIIGYLKINLGSSQTELRDKNTIEIERIYVLKEFHGKRVGQVLFEKVLQMAKEKKADYIWLGVWDQNQRAIAFYRKNGFIEFDKHIFRLGDDEQTDIMMKLEL